MSKLRVFELREPLEPGRSASAELLAWKETKYVRTADTIELFDHVGSHGLKGDRGYCFLSDESKQWEVLSGLFCQDYQKVV